jgi:hypothetical protein
MMKVRRINSFVSVPANAYCLLDNNNSIRNKNESIQSVSSVRFDPVRSGPVQFTWYYQCNASGVVACRLPGTIRCLGQTLYQSNVQLGLPNYSMPVMHTAIPYTGSTADQVVSTVIVQLGAAKHLTRPLTPCLSPL